MKVLFDTNVLMDVLLDRTPFANDSAQVLNHVVLGRLEGLICANSVTTVFYLAKREVGSAQALLHVQKLMGLCEIAAVTRAVLDAAMARSSVKHPEADPANKMPDFEDAVVAESAHHAGAQAIITRNLKDFARSPVRAYTPAQWLAMMPL